MYTRITFLIGLLALQPGLAWPKTVEGPCEYRDGICYRAIGEVVSAEQMERYLTTTPAEPARIVVHDPATGRTRVLENPVYGSPAPGEEGAASDRERVPRALSPVERPWLHDLYRTFVKIEVRFPAQPAGTISVCSGTMIGAHTVLTAGHCIYSHEDGGWAEWAYVYPAMAGYHSTPYGESSMAGLASTTWWVEDQDHRGDTGVIRLAENTGDLTGWPAVQWDYSSLSGTINSGGYPADEGYDGYWLYVDSGAVEDLTDFLICHGAHTIAGMSGGPGWLYDDQTQERHLTAVNSFCYLESGQCCMTRYIDLIEQQRQDSEAEPAGPASDHWVCDLLYFSSLDGCDCQCGLWDPDCDQPGQAVHGCEQDERCIRPGTCICDPRCDGRECGPDGCGSVCGWCDAGATCDDGACVCTPDCTGRQCGSDGCGGSCGSCPDGSECRDGTCACIPDCAGKACGPDGCGGTCGDCEPGLGCVDGACTCAPDCATRQCGPDGCGGSCGECAGDQECVSGHCICTDNCIGRECGSDGCGGSCGSCPDGRVCKGGQCVGAGDGCGCGASAGETDAPWLAFLLLLVFLTYRSRR